jgi:plastocyanin
MLTNKITGLLFFGFSIFCIIFLLPSIFAPNIQFNLDLTKAYAIVKNQKDIIITIPKGSANPEVDITKLGPRQWYLPRQLTVHSNDTVTWINNDTEAHTVTSGTSAGIESLMNNKRGTPNGLFDSASFKPGQTWTRTFTTPGTYTYFCTIHPWMEGVVTVTGKPVTIPNYPVDGSGKKIIRMPIYHFTSDGKMEVGLSWDPSVLLTGRETSFFVSFFDSANNKPNILPFDFVLTQNGKELHRVQTMAQIGMNVQHFVFSNSGQITMKVENIGGQKSWNAQFNSTVFQNSSVSLDAVNKLAEQYKSSANTQSNNPFRVSPLTLIYTAYAVIFGIPAAAGLIYFLYRKGKI